MKKETVTRSASASRVLIRAKGRRSQELFRKESETGKAQRILYCWNQLIKNLLNPLMDSQSEGRGI